MAATAAVPSAPSPAVAAELTAAPSVEISTATPSRALHKGLLTSIVDGDRGNRNPPLAGATARAQAADSPPRLQGRRRWRGTQPPRPRRAVGHAVVPLTTMAARDEADVAREVAEAARRAVVGTAATTRRGAPIKTPAARAEADGGRDWWDRLGAETTDAAMARIRSAPVGVSPRAGPNDGPSDAAGGAGKAGAATVAGREAVTLTPATAPANGAAATLQEARGVPAEALAEAPAAAWAAPAATPAVVMPATAPVPSKAEEAAAFEKSAEARAAAAAGDGATEEEMLSTAWTKSATATYNKPGAKTDNKIGATPARMRRS